MNNEYLRKISDQCRQYARKHYNPRRGRRDVTFEDVTQEMLKIVWQSCKNGNGVVNVVKEKKLFPTWQVQKFFLNALRNLAIMQECKTEDISYQLPESAVIRDESGEIIDFYCPANIDDTEQQESFVDSMSFSEREKWLKEIRKLKKLGYSDSEIVKLLTPAAETAKKKERKLISTRQEGLF